MLAFKKSQNLFYFHILSRQPLANAFVKKSKSDPTCVKSPFLMDKYIFGGIWSKLLWVRTCWWSEHRSQTRERQAEGLAEFFLTTHAKSDHEVSHPKAGSGGPSFPCSLKFVILICVLVKWLGSIKFHRIESISSTSDKIILSFKVGIFPGK